MRWTVERKRDGLSWSPEAEVSQWAEPRCVDSGEQIGGCSVLPRSCFYFQFFFHGGFYYLIEVINLHLQGVFPIVREGETLFLQTSEKTSERSSWFFLQFSFYLG